MKLALFVALAALGQASDPCLKDLEVEEATATENLKDRTWKAALNYYKAGYRREAGWFFQRTLDLRPRNAPLRRFVDGFQDLENPHWKQHPWKPPKKAVEVAFRERALGWELEAARIYLQLGRSAAAKKAEACRKKAIEYFRRAVQMTGEPLEVNKSGQLVAGKAGLVPEDASAQLLKETVTINGARYFKDRMLRSIPELKDVFEARGKRFTVRMLTSVEKASGLLAVMEQAWEQYAAHAGAETLKPLGLFVFADQAGYQRFCDQTENAPFRLANGFASSADGFAVTFEQPGLEEIAVHEGAHLFHYLAFASGMPSWYDEGFAGWFGNGGTMKWEGGKLTTGLKLEKPRLEALKAKMLPLADLLGGNALERINAQDGSSGTFYAQSWALYRFLQETKDPRFAARFERWEGFCLGSAFDRTNQAATAAKLFEQIFQPVLGELEKALKDWIAAQ
jgi:hypothetical protein